MVRRKFLPLKFTIIYEQHSKNMVQWRSEIKWPWGESKKCRSQFNKGPIRKDAIAWQAGCFEAETWGDDDTLLL